MATGTDKVTIKIPRPLYNTLREVIAGRGFDSVTDFIVYVLRDLASSHAVKKSSSDTLSKDEIGMIRKRLESLGYL
jgi:Arc/MetJ-type ribon-helix-helix transcriptional regulator